MEEKRDPFWSFQYLLQTSITPFFGIGVEQLGHLG